MPTFVAKVDECVAGEKWQAGEAGAQEEIRGPALSLAIGMIRMGQEYQQREKEDA